MCPILSYQNIATLTPVYKKCPISRTYACIEYLIITVITIVYIEIYMFMLNKISESVDISEITLWALIVLPVCHLCLAH